MICCLRQVLRTSAVPASMSTADSDSSVFGVGLHDLVLRGGALPGDVDRTGFEVDVLPTDPAQLASPESGECGEVQHRVEAFVVFGDGVEERAELFRLPDLDSWSTASCDVGECCDVAGDLAGLDCGGEGAAERCP